MGQILDEAGLPILDEAGLPIYDEAGPDVLPPVVVVPTIPRLMVSVGPASGNEPVQPLTAFDSCTIKDSLTAGPEVTFAVPSRSPAALIMDGLATDVWVHKMAVPKHRLRLLPVDQDWSDSGDDLAQGVAVGYRRVVEARHVIAIGAGGLPGQVPKFLGVDQGMIIWNLIQHTQAQNGGNLGILLGSVLTGQLRDRTEYKVGDAYGSIINALSDVQNGVWWGINVQKVLDVQLWSAFPRRTDSIVLGKNAANLKRARGRSYANVVGSIGSSTDTYAEWREDTSVGTDPRGRWELFDTSHSTVKLQTSVTENALGLLAKSLHTPSVWTIDLDPTAYFDGGSDYAPGDIVPIVIPASAVDEIGAPVVQVNAQITETSITFDDAGAISVTMSAVEVQ